ncbi:MAG TPA: radical SAM protein [Mobilitalea sp.]|nr:radical SAM protein [Mobilitalea sp.]
MFDFKNLEVEGKYKQFFLDFIVKEEICNLNCDYCMNENNNLKDTHVFERKDGRLNFRLDKVNELVYDERFQLKRDIDAVLDKYDQIFEAPVIKISGGEILMVKNIDKLIRKLANSYEVVQLLTNGILINANFIEKVRNISNLHVQLSLDGHLLEMNYNRVKSNEMQNRLLKALDLLVTNNIITEIYCVITKQNIDYLPQFAEYLLKLYGNKVKLLPFPVRQKPGKKFFPERDHLQGLETLLQDFDKYQDIMPPKLYLEELYTFMKKHKRSGRCYTPLIANQLFDDGVVTPCPNCWTIQLGNLMESIQEVTNNLGTNRIYNLMINFPPVASFCRGCFTETDVLNLYFDDRLSLEELGLSRPLFRGPRVKSSLARLKQIFQTVDLKQWDF